MPNLEVDPEVLNFNPTEEDFVPPGFKE